MEMCALRELCILTAVFLCCLRPGHCLTCYSCEGNRTTACAEGFRLSQNVTCTGSNARCVSLVNTIRNATAYRSKVRRFCSDQSRDYCLTLPTLNLTGPNEVETEYCESCDKDYCNNIPMTRISVYYRITNTVLTALNNFCRYMRNRFSYGPNT